MAGNIRIIDYVPRPNDDAVETVVVVFLIPIENPQKLADAIAAKVDVAAEAVLVDGIAQEWKETTEVIAYHPSGRLTMGTTEAIDPMIAAVLEPDEKAAVVAGTLAVHGPRGFTTSRDIKDGVVTHTSSVQELVDGVGTMFDEINLAYNQARKDLLQRFAAQRSLVGLRINESLLPQLAPDLRSPIAINVKR